MDNLNNSRLSTRPWYNRINLLCLLSLFLLTHFIYTDFLIKQSVVIGLMVIVCLMDFFLYRKKQLLIKENIFILYIGMVILAFFSLPDTRKDNDMYFIVLCILSMGVMLFTLAPSDRQIRQFFKSVEIGSGLIAVYVIYCQINNDFYIKTVLPYLSDEVQKRGQSALRSGYGVPMGASSVFADYVFVLSLIIIFASFLINGWKTSWQKVLYPFFIVLLVAGMFVEGRRGEPLCALLALMIQFLFTLDIGEKKQFIKLTRIVLISSFILLVLLLILFYAGGLDRFIVSFEKLSQSTAGQESDVTSGRVQLWVLGLELFLNNPIVGIGWGNFANFAPMVNWNKIADVHNNYLQILCETGIIGFIFIMVPIIIIYFKTGGLLKRVIRNRTSSALIKVLCSVSFSIQTFFMLLSFIDPSFYKEMYWGMFTIAICFYITAKKSYYYNDVPLD